MDKFPTTPTFDNIDNACLQLISCTWTFDRQSGHCWDDILVVADQFATTHP